MILHVYIFLIGTVLGSFYSVVASRVPLQQSIITPRSHCQHCGYTLGIGELIPIVSFCLQKGRCKYCKEKISYLYLLIEVITGIAFLIPTFFISSYAQLIFIWAVLSLLVIVTMTDILYMLIPNVILIFFAVFFLFERIFLSKGIWWNEIISSLCIFSVLYFIGWIYKGGIGGGDVKLLTLLAFVIGIEGVTITILLASLFGLIFIFGATLFGYMRYRDPIPFAPFISAGTICTLILLYN
ncbi:peptidase A24 [Bacillus manliponensis]|uniref:Peptidase A24 n=1 Tax=Bacillus manliponensis TaxID=574376 RepID=A0A073KDE6_9BACI|nr:A24 family peptidase [Bacillus manliponensis]KEK20338.1 peptidase A24 [Bacillus manliponensis]